MKSVLLFLGSVGLVGLVGCSAPGESSEPTPTAHDDIVTPAPAASADRTISARTDGPTFTVREPATRPAAFVCRAGAFCDDFEAATVGLRWSDSTLLAGGKIERGAESASAGKGSLRLTSRDETSSAFLLQAKGDVTAAWSGALAFAFRVEQVPTSSLGGPEISVLTKDGPITIRVVIEPAGLVLQQLASATCERARCTPTSRVIAPAKANHWYQVRIGLEVNPHQSAPYGLLEASVDDGDVVASDLTVPMFDGPLTLRAGITQGDSRAAIVGLDDVSLLVR